MYVRGTDPSFQDLKISMKGSQMHLCPSLFLFDFFFFIESGIQLSL